MFDEIDDVINAIQEKSAVLAEEARAAAKILDDERRERELIETIGKLNGKRLEFKHRDTYRRNKSFKGRDCEALFMTQDDMDTWQERLLNPEERRGRSRGVNREVQLRPLEYEHKVDF